VRKDGLEDSVEFVDGKWIVDEVETKSRVREIKELMDSRLSL
jgi:hypothetical protein